MLPLTTMGPSRSAGAGPVRYSGPAMTTPPTLPEDADGLLAMAARSMFDVFARSAMGMMVVDREHLAAAARR